MFVGHLVLSSDLVSYTLLNLWFSGQCGWHDTWKRSIAKSSAIRLQRSTGWLNFQDNFFFKDNLILIIVICVTEMNNSWVNGRIHWLNNTHWMREMILLESIDRLPYSCFVLLHKKKRTALNYPETSLLDFGCWKRNPWRKVLLSDFGGVNPTGTLSSINHWLTRIKVGHFHGLKRF